MSATDITPRQRRRREEVAGRRAGYLVTAAVNLTVLWIAHQLLDWEWPAFLTGAFEDLLPWITLSCVATAVVNIVWVGWDPAWFKHLGAMVLDVISFVVAVRTWQIFPFDFADYPSWWETATRVLIIVGIVGSAIAAVVEGVKFARSWSNEAPGTTEPSGAGAHHPHWA